MGVSVRHNARLAAVVALLASVMTVAWFARALQSGSLVDWALTLLVAGIGVLHLLVVRDGRAPLMLADEHGVRVRRGETWSGLRWQDIEHVEVQSASSWWRDGQIVVHPRQDDADVEAGTESGTESGTETGTETGAWSVPLAMTTRVEYDGLTGDLVADLDSLASGQVPVLVLTRLEAEVPERAEKPEKEARDPRPSRADRRAARAAEREQERLEAEQEAQLEAQLEVGREAELAAQVEDQDQDHDQTEPTVEVEPAAAGVPVEVVTVELHDALQEDEAPDTVEDVARPASRLPRFWLPRQHPPVEGPAPVDDLAGDQTDDRAEDQAENDPQDAEQVEPEFEPVDAVRDARPAARAEVTRDSTRRLPTAPAVPAQRASAAPVLVARVGGVVLDGEGTGAPEHAVIGPLVAAARHRARLSIDTLSERTRIRPHVLERIEVDDFGACGGDFYARGHLRTLARVFGLDGDELVALFDEHHAHAEIEARQVFEAELASGIGGGVRAAHTGPRWSLLAACVLALASVWGVARMFNDTPQELVSPAPNVVDSAGLAATDQSRQPRSTLAPLEVHAVGASPQVVVRDRDGKILWAGKLAEEQRQQVIGLAPFDVTASNGAAVKVAFLGKAKGAVGESSAAASKRYGSDAG